MEIGGAVEALRYNLGHLSDDEYRTYANEAARIISEYMGREDIYAGPELDRAKVPARMHDAIQPARLRAVR